MNEVRFVQKIGQVPMAELVENAARLGFVLAGSPTLVSNVPAQLMIQSDELAASPEYMLVEKTGQLKLSTQVEQLLDDGWQIYGSMLAGEVPMQAMVRGDIGVHSMFGFDSGSEGSTPADWQKEIVRIDKLEKQCSELNVAVEANTQAHQSFEARIDQSMGDYITEVDNKVAFFQQANVLLTERVVNLELSLAMESEERRQDVSRLEDMISELLRMMPKGVSGAEIAWQQ